MYTRDSRQVLGIRCIGIDTQPKGKSDAPVAVCQSHHVREDPIMDYCVKPSYLTFEKAGKLLPRFLNHVPRLLGCQVAGPQDWVVWVGYSARAASFTKMGTKKVERTPIMTPLSMLATRNSWSTWKCIPPIWPFDVHQKIRRRPQGTQGIKSSDYSWNALVDKSIAYQRLCRMSQRQVGRQKATAKTALIDMSVGPRKFLGGTVLTTDFRRS
ncbi:hypothetical protein GE21DRAFT_1271049 [Neurospora crassa]|nr:hypothetical protein GE21DRAFT_1271049 [Neurospora crassa]